MEEVKASLADVRVEASCGDGRVRAVADGTGRLIELEIDEAAGPELAGEIRDTINTVLSMSRQEAQRLLAAAAEELGLPLPPGPLGLPGGL
jgi:DNA-binding protein YbaB